jgi:hypothetical protein
LTAEGVVGAAFSVIHARLLQEEPGSLSALLGPLMATVVLPYRGHAAAARESSSARKNPAGLRSPARSADSSGSRADFRPTFRTHLVLGAVAELPGGSNRQVADRAQVADPGQISRLLARLEGLGLLVNTGGQTQGVANAWRLTSRGEEVVRDAG